MKVQELRVGNWLRHKFIDDRYYDTEQHVEKDYLCKVVFINGNDNELVESENGYWHPISEFEPIPLTEQILLDCGFTKKGWEEGYIGTGDYGFSLQTFDLVMGYDCNFSPPKIEYLHQLQNLYFALTGEELTYQPRPI